MIFASSTPSFTRLKRFGLMSVTGADAGRFLHRMSTNSMDELAVGNSCLTAFTNQKARLIAASYVLKTEQDAYQVLNPYDDVQTLLTWLDQYLFAEDVNFADHSDNYELFCLIGHGQTGIPGPEFYLQGGTTTSRLLPCLKDKSEETLNQLLLSGAKELSDLEFETIRVAGVVPFSTNEINVNYHPIQLGLNEAIHWAKGCYIGQEVISRLESKDRAEQTLIGVRFLESDLQKVRAGESILSNGQVIGTLTSVAPLYLAGEANALAVLKRIKNTGELMTDLSRVGLDRLTQGD